MANHFSNDVTILLNTSSGAPPQCPADLDGDRAVGFQDLVFILDAWGNCATCPADLDGSGDVGFGDILRILDAWGNKSGPEDLDGSGTVDFGDLLMVLDAWGACA